MRKRRCLAIGAWVEFAHEHVDEQSEIEMSEREE
jgi:hypothetical protein